MNSELDSNTSRTHSEISELRSLILNDLDLPIDKAQEYLKDMEAKPDKIPQYRKLLTKHLDRTVKNLEGRTHNDKTVTALNRIDLWKNEIGAISLNELVSMCGRWGIPIDKLYRGRITPEVIKHMLDIFLLGQEDYKIQLATAFYTYLMKKNRYGTLPKSNLLVVGPSGSGKTYGTQVLSTLFHVPFAIIHCNNLVQEGIEGSSHTDPFTTLHQTWTVEELEHSIVCFDEFDKLFEKNKSGSDSGAFNARIVNEMLNIIDDKGEVVFKESHNTHTNKRITISSQKMMFVFTGVFDGLINQTTTEVRPIGFVRQNIDTNAKKSTKHVTTEDFIRYGIKPEIMGRIQNFTIIDALTEDELVRLFDMGANSPFAEFEQYFAYNDISTVLTEEGKRALAQIAYQNNLGVRGLKSILQQVLSEDMYDLEVGEDKTLRITKEYVFDNMKE